MTIVRISSAFLAATLPISSPAYAECLSYDGIIRVQGTLMRETFPGPPEYQSIEAGDEPETYWLVVLDRPACVAADPADEVGQSPAVATLERIQLVVSRDQYRNQADKIGHHVTVSGQLFGAFTGHHKTPVLLADVRFDP